MRVGSVSGSVEWRMRTGLYSGGGDCQRWQGYLNSFEHTLLHEQNASPQRRIVRQHTDIDSRRRTDSQARTARSGQTACKNATRRILTTQGAAAVCAATGSLEDGART